MSLLVKPLSVCRCPECTDSGAVVMGAHCMGLAPNLNYGWDVTRALNVWGLWLNGRRNRC